MKMHLVHTAVYNQAWCTCYPPLLLKQVSRSRLQVAVRAKGHLDEARRLRDSLPPRARELLLPCVAAGAYLQALEKSGFDVFEPSLLHVPNYLTHVLSVKWHHYRGTY